MKNLIISSILMLTSTAFAAPSAIEVAAAILKDSDMSEAKNISEMEYTIRNSGIGRHTQHTLRFNHRNQVYDCDTYKLTTTPASPGEFIVSAEISECSSTAGTKLILKNDYTDRGGKTLFRRVFFDENKKFRALNDEEEKIVKRNSPDRINGQSIKVINTDDLEDGIVIIDSTGQIFPVN